MNYEETIEKIHSFQRFGSRLGLERMELLMDILGNPQDDLKVIHVGGTNGKGSVCRYLAEMLKESGLKTGLYTSPFLERFTERIEYDGEEISKEDLVDCAKVVFAAIDEMLERGYESPTEFELVTAIGFVYFSRKALDILLLEVGLGGRGDSTNIIKKPLASVITSISYDHMKVLGNSLAEIAREKAGIIKEGCPLVFNVEDLDGAKVIKEIADEKNCPYFDVTRVKAKEVEKSLDGYSFVLDNYMGRESVRIRLGMIGMHQVSNAICALTVIEVLEKMGIITVREEDILRGIKKAKQKGRLEILRNNPLVIIDGAHNIAGVRALTQVIEDHFEDKKLLLLTGMLAEKDTGSMVLELSKLNGEIIATEPDNPGKLDAKRLCEAFEDVGRRCRPIEDWKRAYEFIVSAMDGYDVIVITGSLYLIGRLRGQVWDEKSSFSL